MKQINVIIIYIIISSCIFLQALFSQNTGQVSWKEHRTLLYTGAGLYKVFSLTDTKQGETSFVLSGTITYRPKKYIFLNSGVDLYKPESGRKLVISLNFIPSIGFEEDNIMLCIGAGGGLFVGEGGMTLRFMTGFKAGYFFNKKYAAAIEIKSPLYYNTAAEFIFTAGVSFAL